jgi:hypothetical protein
MNHRELIAWTLKRMPLTVFSRDVLPTPMSAIAPRAKFRDMLLLLDRLMCASSSLWLNWHPASHAFRLTNAVRAETFPTMDVALAIGARLRFANATLPG